MTADDLRRFRRLVGGARRPPRDEETAMSDVLIVVVVWLDGFAVGLAAPAVYRWGRYGRRRR